jgi:hypothetical protein
MGYMVIWLYGYMVISVGYPDRISGVPILPYNPRMRSNKKKSSGSSIGRAEL